MNHVKYSKINFLKFTAVTLAALLTYEAAATPIAQAAVLPTPANVGAMPNSPMSTGSHLPLEAKSISAGKFVVPSSVGSIVEVYAPSKSSRLIYHLQDVHNNVPAQINLSEMVSLLEAFAAKQNKSLVVAVEGMSGPVDWDRVTRIPNQKAKEDAGSALLRAGYMMGEEYAVMTHQTGRIKIVGLEESKLYDQNWAARNGSINARKHILAAIRTTHDQLQKLAPHNFNALLTSLEKKRAATEDGTLPLGDYVTFLQNIDATIIARHSNLAKMALLGKEESGIDFDKVEKEGRLLVQDVMVSKSEKDMDQMLSDAQALKEGRLSPLSYYSSLLTQTKRDYPLVRSYVAYLRASEGIDSEQLFDEVLQAESEIALKLVKHPLARELLNHIRWVEQQERFFALNLIPQEWEAQRGATVSEIASRHAAIRAFIAEQVNDLGYRFETPALSAKDLSQAYAGARGFYEAAHQRDAAMVNNLLQVISNSNPEKTIVAFIAGGFHTPGMTNLLRKNGFAYEVVRPQLESDVELSQEINLKPRQVNYLRLPGAGAPIAERATKEAESNVANPGPAIENIASEIINPETTQSDEQPSLPKKPGQRPANVYFVALALLASGTLFAVLAEIFLSPLIESLNENPSLRTWIVSGVIALGVLLVGGETYHRFINRHFSPAQNTAGPDESNTHPAPVAGKLIDSGISLDQLDEPSSKVNLPRMLTQALMALNEKDKTSYELKDLNNPELLSKAVDAYNVKVGGLSDIIQGRSLDEVSPRHLTIGENEDPHGLDATLESLKAGERAWMIAAGGRATRMNLPKEFDRLGIAGLTPAILKALKAKGYMDSSKKPTPGEFDQLIERAASGVIVNFDDISLIQRQVLKLMARVRSESNSSTEADEILKGISFIATVNDSNREAIQRQLAKVRFPGSIYIMEQPEEGGLTVPNADGITNWSEHALYPEGHGDPLLAFALRSKGNFQILHDGSVVPIYRPLLKVLSNNGLKKLLFAQVNDLHLLGDMLSENRWNVALSEMENTGAGMVAEMVENKIGQKGGGAIKKPGSGDVIIRDSLAMQSGEFKDIAISKSLARMFMIFDVKSLKNLTWDSLPNYLRYRKDSGLITREIYSGDASSVLQARTMEEPGFELNTFKDRSRIDAALTAIEKQNNSPAFSIAAAEAYSSPLNQTREKSSVTLNGFIAATAIYAAALTDFQLALGLTGLVLIWFALHKLGVTGGSNSEGVTPNGPEKDYDTKGIDKVTRQAGEAERANEKRLSNALYRRSAPTTAELPGFVLIDADSFGDDLVQDAAAMLKLLVELNKKSLLGITPFGRIVVTSEAENDTLGAIVEGANHNLKGVQIRFVRARGLANASDLFKKAQFDGANESNTVVLSKNKDEKFSGARQVQMSGTPELTYAAFAYSHYKQADAVLADLEKVFPMGATLTSQILAAAISLINA